jgi:hypothetical protein
MITFTLECVVGRPTSPGAEGRFSVKSNFYMRGGVVDGWWLVVGGVVCEGCRKCNHPPNKQRAEKKSHTLQKKMYCALGHFITPQKEQPTVSVKRSGCPPIRYFALWEIIEPLRRPSHLDLIAIVASLAQDTL